MRRFVEGIDRGQATLFPECLQDSIDGDNPVRAIDAFVDNLNLSGLGFDGGAPEATGRPSYHPSRLLKLYIYGYLNRVQSSRRLEREAGSVPSQLRSFSVALITVHRIPMLSERLFRANGLTMFRVSLTLRTSITTRPTREMGQLDG
jgi:hypothetical protein